MEICNCFFPFKYTFGVARKEKPLKVFKVAPPYGIARQYIPFLRRANSISTRRSEFEKYDRSLVGKVLGSSEKAKKSKKMAKFSRKFQEMPKN